MMFREGPTTRRVRRRVDGAVGTVLGSAGRALPIENRTADTRVAAYFVQWRHDLSLARVRASEVEPFGPCAADAVA